MSDYNNLNENINANVSLLNAEPAAMVMDDAPLRNDIVLDLVCPSFLGGLLSCLSIPCCVPCGGVRILRVREENVLLSFGKYQGTIREPGWYYANPCCLQTLKVSTAQEAVVLANVKVADAKGNPLMLSAVVTYKVVDSRKASLEVKGYGNYLRTQGQTVLKKVASMYPYEAKGDEPSLKSEADHLRIHMVKLLQERVSVAGIVVLNFELNDLAYAPEIAQQMLVRQQAEAIVDARTIIAEGAVEIVSETIQKLGAKGIQFDPAEKAKLASNLVTVICAESGVQPTVNVGSA